MYNWRFHCVSFLPVYGWLLYLSLVYVPEQARVDSKRQQGVEQKVQLASLKILKRSLEIHTRIFHPSFTQRLWILFGSDSGFYAVHESRPYTTASSAFEAARSFSLRSRRKRNDCDRAFESFSFPATMDVSTLQLALQHCQGGLVGTGSSATIRWVLEVPPEIWARVVSLLHRQAIACLCAVLRDFTRYSQLCFMIRRVRPHPALFIPGLRASYAVRDDERHFHEALICLVEVS
ncbi:hypothetical protein C8R43DRAFT_246486 [Mycena crocata]|nr:hypothetical protein C8R43DRAFT_246486 [Mycena crocata]